MKFLLLFLISFSLHAGYMSKVDIEDCNKSDRVFHTKASTCIDDCYEIPRDYQCETHVTIPDKNLKDKAENCYTEEQCDDAFPTLVCDDGFTPIKNYDLMEVYCTKFVSKHIAIDQAKKNAYDLIKQAEKDQEKADKDAKKVAKDYFKNLDCSTLLSTFEINACNYIKR